MRGLSDDEQRAWRRGLLAAAGAFTLAAAGYLVAANSGQTPTDDASATDASQSASTTATATQPAPQAGSTSVNLDEMRRLHLRYGVEPLRGSVVWHVSERPNDPNLPRNVWPRDCNIHHPCAKPHVPPHCKPGATAATWESLRERAQLLRGTVVEVSGKLDVGPRGAEKAIYCTPCCHRSSVDIVLDNRQSETMLEDSSHALGLEGYGCHGDESKGCCNALADGSEVIAKGRLEPLSGDIDRQELVWQLRDVSLCVVAPAATH